MNVLAVEHVKLNVQLALFLRAQIILRLMLTLVWTVALALLSVLQELFLRVNKPADNEKIKRKGAVQDLILVTDLSFFASFCIFSHTLPDSPWFSTVAAKSFPQIHNSCVFMSTNRSPRRRPFTCFAGRTCYDIDA